jgi:hypothetical protein
MYEELVLAVRDLADAVRELAQAIDGGPGLLERDVARRLRRVVDRVAARGPVDDEDGEESE